MLPDPLHPALVHFPLVLAVFAPLLAAAAFWAIHTGRASQRVWLAVVVFQIVLAVSAWTAVETGEDEEERVERVVAEQHIEEHEENAERLLVMAGIVIPLAIAGGWLGGTLGLASRGLTVVLTLGTLAAAVSTGHTGGQLVYEHGAAAAYVKTGGAASPDGHPVRGDHDDDERAD